MINLHNNPYYIAEDALIFISQLQRGAVLKLAIKAAVLVAVVSCPTGAVAAEPLPMCYVVIAKDADYPSRIRAHEMAHCWGWWHPERKEKPKFGQLKSSFTIPWKYVMKGDYPRDRVEVYNYDHTMVAQECDGNPYGCAWGGLMK